MQLFLTNCDFIAWLLHGPSQNFKSNLQGSHYSSYGDFFQDISPAKGVLKLTVQLYFGTDKENPC